MTLPAKATSQGELAESTYIQGDLSKLNSEQRTAYYLKVCHSLGLNPLTKPFEYITLNGRLQLYALRSCADQLRKINGVSLEIVSRDVADGILTVHVRARLPDGRTDEDLGSVSFPDTLKGEARANTELKAITKAKRRATLSICGLGWLDETEVADIPGQRANPIVTTPQDVTEHQTEYDEQGEPIDNIPSGEPGVERMSKAMARPEYAKLLSDIRNVDSLVVLMDWGTRNANRVASLPLDWQEILRGQFREKMIELGWQPKIQEFGGAQP